MKTIAKSIIYHLKDKCCNESALKAITTLALQQNISLCKELKEVNCLIPSDALSADVNLVFQYCDYYMPLSIGMGHFEVWNNILDLYSRKKTSYIYYILTEKEFLSEEFLLFLKFIHSKSIKIKLIVLGNGIDEILDIISSFYFKCMFLDSVNDCFYIQAIEDFLSDETIPIAVIETGPLKSLDNTDIIEETQLKTSLKSLYTRQSNIFLEHLPSLSLTHLSNLFVRSEINRDLFTYYSETIELLANEKYLVIFNCLENHMILDNTSLNILDFPLEISMYISKKINRDFYPVFLIDQEDSLRSFERGTVISFTKIRKLDYVIDFKKCYATSIQELLICLYNSILLETNSLIYLDPVPNSLVYKNILDAYKIISLAGSDRPIFITGASSLERVLNKEETLTKSIIYTPSQDLLKLLGNYPSVNHRGVSSTDNTISIA